MSERRNTMRWTESEDARLTKLYAEGLTFVQIAERFGCSKSKVAGRLHRLKLTGKRPMGRYRHAVQSKKAGPKPKAKPAAKARPTPKATAEKSARPPKPVLVRAARPSDNIWRPTACQFPIGDPKAPDFHFCGQSITPDGRAYCDEHHARCYTKRPEKAPGEGGIQSFKQNGWGGYS